MSERVVSAQRRQLGESAREARFRAMRENDRQDSGAGWAALGQTQKARGDEKDFADGAGCDERARDRRCNQHGGGEQRLDALGEEGDDAALFAGVIRCGGVESRVQRGTDRQNREREDDQRGGDRERAAQERRAVRTRNHEW